jgi:hypothetical protein
VCRVPRLKGRPLPRAKAALKQANCRLGKVRRPHSKRPRGGRLLVRSTSPAHGATPADDTVGLQLAWHRPGRHRHHPRSQGAS